MKCGVQNDFWEFVQYILQLERVKVIKIWELGHVYGAMFDVYCVVFDVVNRVIELIG
jgi:hypothetical protein